MRQLLFVLAASLVGPVFAQSKFEVASVKPSEERGMMYVRTLPGGRLVVNAPVRLMLLNAFGIQFSQVAGAPDWLSSETWSIDAARCGEPDAR